MTPTPAADEPEYLKGRRGRRAPEAQREDDPRLDPARRAARLQAGQGVAHPPRRLRSGDAGAPHHRRASAHRRTLGSRQSRIAPSGSLQPLKHVCILQYSLEDLVHARLLICHTDLSTVAGAAGLGRRSGLMTGGRSDAADPSFVDAVARRVVELLREEGAVSREGPRLLTVAAVSQEFGVSTDWLYANAGRLGAIRLGSGPRARLRFDRATIADRIATVASHASRYRSSQRGKRRRRTREGVDSDLLPIRGRGAYRSSGYGNPERAAASRQIHARPGKCSRISARMD